MKPNAYINDVRCELETIAALNKITGIAVKTKSRVDWQMCEMPDVFAADAGEYNYAGAVLNCAGDVSTTASLSTNPGATWTLAVSGTALAMSDDTKSRLYGSDANQTHAIVLLIAAPTTNYTDLSLKRGSSSYVDFTSADITEIDGITYIPVVLGLYDSGGVVTCATNVMTIKYLTYTVDFALNLSGVTLAE